MKTLLKLEEVGLFIVALYVFSTLHFAWWWFPALLLVPDVGMVGYAINPKIGAFTYNVFHHRLVASVVAVYAMASGNQYWQLVAVILFAHISLDRMLGFGLKYTNAFKHTHLENLGEA